MQLTCFSISDRILVMRRGRVTGEFDAGATQEMLMERAVPVVGDL